MPLTWATAALYFVNIAGTEGLEPSTTELETGMLPLHYVPIQWTLSVPTRDLKLFRLACAPATPKVHLFALLLLDVTVLAAQLIDFLPVFDPLVQGSLRMTV